MTINTEQANIACDGMGCLASTQLPVALRPSLSVRCRPAEGWLFVADGNGGLHFCPNCARAYLMRLRLGDDSPADALQSALSK